MTTLYFDHAATTPLDTAVLAQMLPYLTEYFGNPSSPHAMGRSSLNAIDHARDQVAAVLNCSNAEVIFTGGGSEGDNLAVKGVAESYLRQHGRAHVIVSAIEHHAVLHAAEALQRQGVEVSILPVGSDGIVVADDLVAALQPHTAVVSVMYANNEIGTIQPIAQLAEICRQRGVVFHTDAVQAAGLLPLDVKALGIDMLTITAHKFYGPKGVGAMYIRRGVELWPQIHGGAQERRRRAGTENVAGIVGLGAALALAESKREAEVARLMPLRDMLQEIAGEIAGVRVTGHAQQRLANNASFVIDDVDGDSLLIMLDRRGICASSGSACTSGSMEPSHVLQALGVLSDDTQAALRLTIGRSTTLAHVEKAIADVVDVVAKLRG
jgi:cysteine desulfurase